MPKDAHERYQNLSEEEKCKERKKTKKQTNKQKKKKCERCQNFTEEEKKRQYYRESNENLFDDQKQKLIEYRRNYYLAHKK